MSRIPKLLAPALVVALTFCAMTATAAQAEGKFTASSYPTHVFGSDSNDRFTILGQTVECKKQTFTGVLTGAAESLSLTPTYEECTDTSNAKPVTITLNGCTFEPRVVAVTSKTDAHGIIDIVCPPGKVIEVHIFNDKSHLKSWCTVTIPPQKDKKVTYTNKGNGFRLNGGVNSTEESGETPEIEGSAKGECTFGVEVKFSNAVYDLGVALEGTEGHAIDVG